MRAPDEATEGQAAGARGRVARQLIRLAILSAALGLGHVALSLLDHGVRIGGFRWHPDNAALQPDLDVFSEVLVRQAPAHLFAGLALLWPSRFSDAVHREIPLAADLEAAFAAGELDSPRHLWRYGHGLLGIGDTLRLAPIAGRAAPYDLTLPLWAWPWGDIRREAPQAGASSSCSGCRRATCENRGGCDWGSGDDRDLACCAGTPIADVIAMGKASVVCQRSPGWRAPEVSR